jgi:hypothetical protein
LAATHHVALEEQLGATGALGLRGGAEAENRTGDRNRNCE